MTIHLLFVTVTFKRNIKTKDELNDEKRVRNLMEKVKNRQLML
ncbi:YrzI family small protein [Metabacillus sp. KIGAM252]|uniref:YrzI family small protein n=1 Tax=Metabacillus flavus TaxID=2823519 RepID=A0ABS5LG93_9BACI|nr:YrzI family small protein [Metabacillus flavus]MBS2969781.1 YrzI family small protein [Metabacillus flavus]